MVSVAGASLKRVATGVLPTPPPAGRPAARPPRKPPKAREVTGLEFARSGSENFTVRSMLGKSILSRGLCLPNLPTPRLAYWISSIATGTTNNY